MNNNWFFSRRLLPTTISAAILALTVLLAPRPVAADTPAWLQQAAHETYANVPAEAQAIILYDEQETTVKDNGEVETLYRRAYRILRPGGRDYGLLRIPFDNETRITWLKAWCIPKDGKDYEVKEKDAVETGLSDSFYSDDRTKVLEIPAATPGNVIGYEYRQKSRPFILQDEWRIQYSIPMRRSRFTLNLPQGWEFSAKWIHFPDQNPKNQTSNQIVWEVENVPAIKSEPAMPPLRAVVARMGVTYHPSGGGGKALGPSTWDQIGIWFANLSSGSFQPSPELQQKVKEVTANASTWHDKVQALTGFVQSHIRYVDIEIGIGGFQPHPAADVFKHQYGDCKDKATLLGTMLHEAGIESYLALAQIYRGIVAPEFASAITFNHAILAVRVPDGEPSKDLYGIVDDPKLGKLLFVDPTSEYTPFGYLPAALQENYVLVASPQRGELVHLPLLPPERNRLERHAKFEIHPDGSLSGSVEEVSWGELASNDRAQLLESSGADREKALEGFLGTFLHGFHLTQATTGNLDKVNEPLSVNYKFTAERYAKTAGDLLVVRPRVLGEKADYLADGEPRNFPVQYDSASLQTDDFEITLPPGYSVEDVPPPTKTESEFASYTSQIQVTGNTIHYTRTFQVKQVLVPVEKLDEFKKFNRQIAADERASVVLHRGSQ